MKGMVLLSYTAGPKALVVILCTILLNGCVEAIILTPYYIGVMPYAAFHCATKPEECWCVSPDRKFWKNSTGVCPEGWTFYSIEPPPDGPPNLVCKSPEDKMIYRVDEKQCPADWENVTEAKLVARKAELEVMASKGDDIAMYDLSTQLRSEDIHVSWGWLCRAADRGHPEARTDVGLHYMSRSWERSDEWETTYKDSLGALGIRVDDRVAYMWFLLAGNTDPRATYMRKWLDQHMEPSELRDAKEMVDDWRPGQCPTKEQPHPFVTQSSEKIGQKPIESKVTPDEAKHTGPFAQCDPPVDSVQCRESLKQRNVLRGLQALYVCGPHGIDLIYNKLLKNRIKILNQQKAGVFSTLFEEFDARRHLIFVPTKTGWVAQIKQNWMQKGCDPGSTAGIRPLWKFETKFDGFNFNDEEQRKIAISITMDRFLKLIKESGGVQ